VGENDEDVLKKADALMRRRRIFVAGGANDPDGAKGLAPAAEAEEDIPLLTEVVSPEAIFEAATPSTVDVAALRRVLAAEVESWLDRAMPLHVQHVLDGITDQLILQLSAKARTELLPRLHELLEAARQGQKPGSTGD
jgi:hypothetical protein